MVCSGMSEVMNHDSRVSVAATEELIFYAVKELFIDDEPASEERLGTKPDVYPSILSLPRQSVG